VTGDPKWMRLALEQAALGRHTARPNPMVGAVIVRDGALVALGHHERVGGPHAEVVALRAAGELARGADVYVNLEPCSHFGRTPPCADALLNAGVGRVFTGMIDPNPRVSGQGVERLRSAGVEVHVGMLESECRRLNEDFIVYITEKRPFVTVKLAISLDGRIADFTGNSRWISNESSRLRVQTMRAESDAILVGAGTLRSDNPRLTVRDVPVVQPPVRWVLDAALEIADSAAVLDTNDAPTVLVHSASASALRRDQLIQRGVSMIALATSSEGRLPLGELLGAMAARGHLRVLVEGGGVLAGGLLDEGLVDRLELFVAPLVLGDRGRPAFAFSGGVKIDDAIRGRSITCEQVDGDVRLTVDLR
jgi:diaminohydroxyphosphoribosylaminopyrimidine deaminase/5-amino-6-(5-phosphoribosylamino)uracil reductase